MAQTRLNQYTQKKRQEKYKEGHWPVPKRMSLAYSIEKSRRVSMREVG
jgi:hypothetical protein